MLFAIARPRPFAAPRGVTSATSPMRSASSAPTASPVKSIFAACRAPTARVKATPGEWQKRPILTPGAENVAASSHTAMSQFATNSRPAPTAAPWTQQTTGTSASRRQRITAPQASKRRRAASVLVAEASLSRASSSSRASWPAQNAPAAAESRSTQRASLTSASAAASASSVASDSALRFSGRSRLKWSTAQSSRRRTRTPASGRASGATAVECRSTLPSALVE
mmetsp:Transcript_1135/g.4004  ORF Transcript_1135/g.4004 Transcript_1135/m.4004 type:complete len:225 (-) Transcript_1135:690-1364(-)